MRYVKCNLCGADDYHVVYEKGVAQLHRIVKCNRCGLMYANPQEEIDVETYIAGNVPDVYRPEEHWEYFQKQHIQIPDNIRALKVVNELQPKRGKLLEIGSYCGIFLDRIGKDGWEAQGLEPFKPAADYSRAQFNLNIIDGALPQPQIPDGTYDAVMMLHVIEHMPDPTESLSELHRLLRQGGVIAIETPRFEGLMHKVLGRRERSLSNCNGHIYFFSVETLSKLLEKCGFEVARVELVGRTLTLQRLMTNVGIISRSPKVRGFLAKIGPKLGFDRVRLHINVRDMQRVYAIAR